MKTNEQPVSSAPLPQPPLVSKPPNDRPNFASQPPAIAQKYNDKDAEPQIVRIYAAKGPSGPQTSDVLPKPSASPLLEVPAKPSASPRTPITLVYQNEGPSMLGASPTFSRSQASDVLGSAIEVRTVMTPSIQLPAPTILSQMISSRTLSDHHPSLLPATRNMALEPVLPPAPPSSHSSPHNASSDVPHSSPSFAARVPSDGVFLPQTALQVNPPSRITPSDNQRNHEDPQVGTRVIPPTVSSATQSFSRQISTSANGPPAQSPAHPSKHGLQQNIGSLSLPQAALVTSRVPTANTSSDVLPLVPSNKAPSRAQLDGNKSTPQSAIVKAPLSAPSPIAVSKITIPLSETDMPPLHSRTGSQGPTTSTIESRTATLPIPEHQASVLRPAVGPSEPKSSSQTKEHNPHTSQMESVVTAQPTLNAARSQRDQGDRVQLHLPNPVSASQMNVSLSIQTIPYDAVTKTHSSVVPHLFLLPQQRTPRTVSGPLKDDERTGHPGPNAGRTPQGSGSSLPQSTPSDTQAKSFVASVPPGFVPPSQPQMANNLLKAERQGEQPLPGPTGTSFGNSGSPVLHTSPKGTTKVHPTAPPDPVSDQPATSKSTNNTLEADVQSKPSLPNHLNNSKGRINPLPTTMPMPSPTATSYPVVALQHSVPAHEAMPTTTPNPPETSSSLLNKDPISTLVLSVGPPTCAKDIKGRVQAVSQATFATASDQAQALRGSASTSAANPDLLVAKGGAWKTPKETLIESSTLQRSPRRLTDQGKLIDVCTSSHNRLTEIDFLTLISLQSRPQWCYLRCIHPTRQSPRSSYLFRPRYPRLRKRGFPRRFRSRAQIFICQKGRPATRGDRLWYV